MSYKNPFGDFLKPQKRTRDRYLYTDNKPVYQKVNLYYSGMNNTSKINNKTLEGLGDMQLTDNFKNPDFYKSSLKQIQTSGITTPSGQTFYTSTGDKSTSFGDQLTAMGEHRRRLRLATNMKKGLNNPNLKTANKIRTQLGLKPIIVGITGFRRAQRKVQTGVYVYGRHDTIRDVSPEKFLTDYYEKKAVVGWAKEIGGLKLEDTDTGKFRTGEKTWTSTNFSFGRTKINKRNPLIYHTTTLYETKKPENEAQKTIVLFDKFKIQRDAKKKRYLDLYEPIDESIKTDIKKIDDDISTTQAELGSIKKQNTYHPARHPKLYASFNNRSIAGETRINELKNKKVQLEQDLRNADYSYYAITDQQLTEAEKYKRNLITEIQTTDKTTDDILTKLPTEQADTSDDDIDYKKMKLRQLEKEYEREIAEYNSADEKRVRRLKSEAQFGTTYPKKIPLQMKRRNRRRR